MYVITQRAVDDLDTQIVQGYGDDNINAAIVFTREEPARRYLEQVERSDMETIAELTGEANLAFLVKLSNQGVDQILVDPVHCSDDDRLKDFGVLRVHALIERMTGDLSKELNHATELPMSDGKTFVYHCHNCGSIEHRDEQETLECCGHAMVLGATTQA